MKLETIGSYQIIEKIAEGGTGVVYKAFDQKTKKIVAVKTLKEGINNNSEVFLRFKKEAQLLQKMSHPNILNFIDFLEEDQNLFIITEYIQGKNLKQIVDENKLSLDQRVEIIYQISKALDYVHSEGIIHRDIKASNIILDQQNQVKILDFGVANLMNFQKLFLKKDEIVGSFAYMSPEQSGMLKRNIDHRSDLYSLGILFYQIVTGTLPYKAREIGELLHQHIAKMPEEAININKSISPIINKIILKLIKKDPDERYQTSYGLEKDLELYLSLNTSQKMNFYLELGKKDRTKNLNYRAQLVGRKNELKLLLTHLNNTVLRKGHCTFITAKSGMGKSRLISEIQKFTGSKNAFYVQITSAERNQNHPFYSWKEAVRSLIDFMNKMPLAKKTELIERLRNIMGEDGMVLVRIIPELEPILGAYHAKMSFSKQENELFIEKLKDFFIAFAAPTSPLVIVFDDAHFWDIGSIQFFNYIKDYLAAESIYLVLSAREEELLKVKELYDIIKKEAQASKISIISLYSLSQEDTADLLNEIFGCLYHGLNELAARLYESSQGNPFLMIENVKTLVEEAIIVQQNDSWEVDLEKLSHFRFSSSISDKILTRLLKLNPLSKDILSCASILGKNFNFNFLYSILIEIFPEMTQEKLLESLQESMVFQLVNETLSEKGEIEYSFVHDKIIETLLEQIPAKQEQTIHLLAAKKLEEDKKNLKEHIYKLAYHYLAAGSKNKAYYYNLESGRQALETYSFKLAINFYQHALDILKNNQKETAKVLMNRINLTLEIVEIRLQIANYEENIRLLEEIHPKVKELEDQTYLAKTYFYMGKNYYLLANQNKAMEYFKLVIPIAEKLKLPELLALPYCAIGRTNCFLLYYQESIEYIQKGLELMPRKPKDQFMVLERVFSLGVLGQSYASLGKIQEAVHIIEEIQDLGQLNPNNLVHLYVVFYTTTIYALAGEPHKAIFEGKRTIEAAKELKNKLIEVFTLLGLGRANTSLGKYEEAIRYIVQCINLGKENNLMLALGAVYLFLAENYVLLGNYKVARETLNEAEKYSAFYFPKLYNLWKKRISAFIEIFSYNSNHANALQEINEAIALGDEIGEYYEYFQGLNWMTKGLILYKMMKLDQAEVFFNKGKTLLQKLGMKYDLQNLEIVKENIMNSEGFRKAVYSLAEGDATHTSTITFTQTEFSYQRQLKYLLKLSEQLAQVHDMVNLLPKIMSLAIEVTGAERGILFLYENLNDPQSKMVIRAKTSIDPNENNGMIVYSESLLTKTITSLQGQLIVDAEKELSKDKTVTDYKMKSIITVPLLTSGKILGAIYLDNRQVKGLFTEENFELMKAFAVESAISIENARLYEEVQQKAKIEQEMEIAQDIQTSILPFVSENDHYEIAAFMQTASEVGGDYYDFYLKEAPYFGVFGDVSGHGIKSGLLMMMAEVAFNTLMTDRAIRTQNLEEIYQKINIVLYSNIQERLSKKSKMGMQYNHMYMTFRMFRFDGQGNFEMFGNDHAEPFICRADSGEIETIGSRGFLLGIMEDAVLNQKPQQFQLNAGDLLILYSDGITESKNEIKTKGVKRAMFGEKKLFEIIQQNRGAALNQIIAKVIQATSEWMKIQEDDITLAIMRKK